MAGQLLEMKAGTDKTFRMTLYDTNGAVVTGYSGASTLTAKVWPGDDQAATFTPTCAWITPGSGLFSVTISAAQSAVTPAIYRLSVTVTSGGVISPAFDGRLKILDSVGSASALATYCTYEDMRRLAPWIGELQSEDDQAGFAEQRHLARKWLDSIIQKHYRDGGWGSYYTTFDHLIDGYQKHGGHDTTLQGYLDVSGLILNSDVVETTARYAIGLVLASRLTATSDKGQVYKGLGARYMAEAKAKVSTLTVGIDTTSPLDGTADLYISLATVDPIYA